MSHWQWSLQMASLFPHFFFFFLPNREKQINNTGCCFSFTFFSLLFLPLTFLLTCTSPVLPDTQNNLLNGMQNLTFAAFWSPDPLKSGTCHLLFHGTPAPPPLPVPCFAPRSIPRRRGIGAEYQSVLLLFPIPSWFRPEDLTFKWQLFPDLFRNLPPCLAPPAGTRSEASRPTESVSGRNAHTLRLLAFWKHDKKKKAARCARVWATI